jgi:hypothetical protein
MTAVCVLNSLALNVSESERWYDALKEFAKQTPMRDPKHRAAVEARRTWTSRFRTGAARICRRCSGRRQSWRSPQASTFRR